MLNSTWVHDTTVPQQM